MKNERIFISHKGDPSVLKLISDEVNPPGPSEVLIRVRAAGVSFADVMVREGIYPGVKLPATPGYDVVGEVESVGDEVRNFRKGDRVAAMTVVGGYSRYISVPSQHAVPVPSELESGAAVCMVLNYLTAFQMMTRCCHLVADDTILVHGAAGGVGTALLQLASIKGLKAYGTASSGKLHMVEQLGGVPIDYAIEDFVARIDRDTPDGVAAFLPSSAINGDTRLLRCVRGYHERPRPAAESIDDTSSRPLLQTNWPSRRQQGVRRLQHPNVEGFASRNLRGGSRNSVGVAHGGPNCPGHRRTLPAPERG